MGFDSQYTRWWFAKEIGNFLQLCIFVYVLIRLEYMRRFPDEAMRSGGEENENSQPNTSVGEKWQFAGNVCYCVHYTKVSERKRYSLKIIIMSSRLILCWFSNVSSIPWLRSNNLSLFTLFFVRVFRFSNRLHPDLLRNIHTHENMASHLPIRFNYSRLNRADVRIYLLRTYSSWLKSMERKFPRTSPLRNYFMFIYYLSYSAQSFTFIHFFPLLFIKLSAGYCSNGIRRSFLVLLLLLSMWAFVFFVSLFGYKHREKRLSAISFVLINVNIFFCRSLCHVSFVGRMCHWPRRQFYFHFFVWHWMYYLFEAKKSHRIMKTQRTRQHNANIARMLAPHQHWTADRGAMWGQTN